MKKLLALLLSSTMLYACSEMELEVVEEDQPEEVVVEKPKKEKLKSTPENVLAIYKETLSDAYEVNYIEDKKTFTFTPNNPSLEMDLKDMMENKQPLDDWIKIVDSLRQLSTATGDKLGEGYMHAIMNPFNEENVILIIKDGTVLLDAFENK